jgi:DNA-binding GntR family transcriptional regulator
MTISLKNQIANGLRSRLLANEWTPATRLKELSLAQEFGVSRGPIRDVMLELTKEGYLRMLPNCGVTVAGFPKSRARRIYVRARQDLEALALREGFQRWPEEALKKLQKHLRLFRVAAEGGDLAEVIQYDLSFHRHIIEHYTEENLLIVWLPLMTTLALPYSRHSNLMESYEEHASIVAALERGELAAATRLLKAHIQ